MSRRPPRALALLVLALGVSGCAPRVLTDTRRETSPPATTSTPAPSRVPTPTLTPAPTPSSSPSPLTGAPAATARVIGTVAAGLPAAWGLAALPDGTVLVTTRDQGHLYRVALGTGKVVDLGAIPGVDSDGGTGEGGLLGVAVSPFFTTDKTIYLYHSTARDNRIVSLRLLPGSPATLSAPTLVLGGIPRGDRHDGGRIVFGPDGMLYVGTGDVERPGLAPDLGSLAGKVLRMTPTGDPAPGNPVAGSVVYSSGLRNVQGLAFDDEGRLFAADLGARGAGELDRIEPGRDYGWPVSDRPASVDPVARLEVQGSPGGLTVAGGSAFLAQPAGARLWSMPLAGAEITSDPQPLVIGDVTRLRSVIAVGDTRLLLAGDDRLLLGQVG